MKYLSFCLSLFVIYPSFALDKKSFDLSGNGKKDRFEYYEKNKLIKIEMDKNNDGKIDYWRTYTGETYAYEELIDEKFSGKVSRKNIQSKHPTLDGKVLIKVYVDKDGDGKFEVEYNKTIDLIQKDTISCSDFSFQKDLSTFSKNALEIAAVSGDGFIETKEGLKIEGSCLKNWGEDFLKLADKTFKTGLSCLNKIDMTRTSDKVTAAGENSFYLKELLKSKTLKVVCSEEDYDWDGTAGHASTEVEQVIAKKNIKHPYISLNPNDPVNKPATEEDLKEIQRTLFHESFHNLGHKHGHGMEFSYTCETCCFPTDDSSPADSENVACKLCMGDYAGGESDPEYIDDMISWSQNEYRYFLSENLVRDNIKENSTEHAMVSFVKAHTTYSNAVGPDLMELLIAKGKVTSPDQMIFFEVIKQYQTYDNDIQKNASKAIAEILYYTYVEKSSAKALASMKKNKEVIRKLSLEKDNYKSQSMYEVLDKTLFDNWINKYPNTTEDESMGFFEISDYLESK